MEFLVDFGYLGLFVAAFLAATILPLSSELVLTALLLNDLSPEMLVLVATVGNVLGSLTNYGLGYWASKGIIQKWLKMSEKEFVKAEERFEKYGLMSLLFAWVPIIGDPLTVIAGILRVNLIWFIVLVSLGKFLRYYILASMIISG
ncbi:YqaA family protein [Kangiella sediminilitoris]|uniref:SNARE associated Golgi protein n=1 Tax=Kangiella sediminilitoris TaxID=1144748 RepID=A0A1B3BAP0_9GAMM|nr:YqaA family protein [Kangiella sediminilitoris]AOE49847.1 SNARE associated Golgi protein [Kangiella sediminilitoris]